PDQVSAGRRADLSVALALRMARWRKLRSHPLDRSLPAIAAAGQGFDVARIVGRVAQRLPEAAHRRVDAVLELDDGGHGPEFAADFLTGHEVARPVEQHGEDSKRLFGHGDSFLSLAAQLARTK